MRGIILDVVLIENVSRQPINIDGLFQSISAESRLRASPSTVPTPKSLHPLSETLLPGQSLLVPTKITLVPAQSVLRTFGYRQTSNDIYKRLGTSGLSGESSHRAPIFKNYLYGPEIAIGGLSINNDRIDLTKYSANFVDLTFTYQEGSCPYLVSLDPRSGDRTEHGKILHSATSKNREDVETMTFPGFRSHFRLEEREPEIAFIDQVELAVVLKSGETILLTPDHLMIAARDGKYLPLYWSDVVDIQFRLPIGLVEDEIIESRLSVTGYYLSYSSVITETRDKPWLAPFCARHSGASIIPTFLRPSPLFGVACPVLSQF
jgi:hypothetical protein